MIDRDEPFVHPSDGPHRTEALAKEREKEIQRQRPGARLRVVRRNYFTEMPAARSLRSE